MYKLFLCLRYLRRRVIAYFAVLAVALCVAMVLIVASVMDGFLRKMEQAAKGLYGDVVVQAASLGGLGQYDEFIAEAKRRVPGVEAASPFIGTFGILQVPRTEYRRNVQIVGIRLPERVDVTDFEKGLWAQAGRARPDFDPPVSLLLARLNEHINFTREIKRREQGRIEEGADVTSDDHLQMRRLDTALALQRRAMAALLGASRHQKEMAELSAKIKALRQKVGEKPDATLDALEDRLGELVKLTGYRSPRHRMILGLGIPALSFRTEQGETVRLIAPGHRVVLTLLPLGGIASPAEARTRTFTVVDDCRTDVASIDSEIVYMPLSTLQVLYGMGPDYDPDDPTKVVAPPRCTMIHIKVRDEFATSEGQLREVAREIRGVWADFHAAHPDAAGDNVDVQTWRQIQAKYIAPIEKQRTLVVLILGIISVVAVVLIFVIFYMIVMQKTRDIGVLKAVGASSFGVAGIFLGYGAAVGLVGSIIGTVGGFYFVRYINPIQDALDRWMGFRVWTRDVFLFEKIPNQVEANTAIWIVICAIVAGLAGALLPAIRAARMQPVEALRYE